MAEDKESMHSNNDINDIDTYIPRDAVTILNELKPGLTYAISHSSNENIIGSVEVDGKTYHGSGKSEITAKQSAAEDVLKDLFFDMIFATMTGSDDIESTYNTNSWKLLGSLAMFKLLEEWLLFYMSEKVQKENHQVSPPETKLAINDSLKSDSKIKPCHDSKRKNEISIHTNPTVILSKLHSHLKFIEVNINNKPPFTFSLTLDNIVYTGEPAGNKKDAKQNTARKVLIEKYDYHFT